MMEMVSDSRESSHYLFLNEIIRLFGCPLLPRTPFRSSSLESCTWEPRRDVFHFDIVRCKARARASGDVYIRIGKLSTKNAPGWVAFEKWSLFCSARSTNGSNPSWTSYPCEILKIITLMVLHTSHVASIIVPKKKRKEKELTSGYVPTVRQGWREDASQSVGQPILHGESIF